jgi:hypothetical protein
MDALRTFFAIVFALALAVGPNLAAGSRAPASKASCGAAKSGDCASHHGGHTGKAANECANCPWCSQACCVAVLPSGGALQVGLTPVGRLPGYAGRCLERKYPPPLPPPRRSRQELVFSLNS